MGKLYVLKLASDKYYVGRTTNFIIRIVQHLNGEGSEYTKLYKVVDVELVRELKDQYDEDNTTISYMEKYGIDNVRGGLYSTVQLTSETKKSIKEKIWSARGVCIRCGNGGHYISNCANTVDVFGDKIGDLKPTQIPQTFTCKHCKKTLKTKAGYVKHEEKCGNRKIACFKCGKYGHLSNGCVADNPEVICYNCKKQGHYKTACLVKIKKKQ